MPQLIPHTLDDTCNKLANGDGFASATKNPRAETGIVIGGRRMTPFEFVIARITVEDTGYASPCWLWNKSVDRTGYAKATIRIGGRTERVHRATYKMLVGEIGDGLHLDHLCRVRHCVNPAHLEAVTPRENTLRGTGPSAINARKSHCIRGHEFSPENTSVDEKGRRWCLTCNRVVRVKKEGSRRNAPVTHCYRGHEFTPENTRFEKNPRPDCPPLRRCRVCCSDVNRRKRERIKARAKLSGGAGEGSGAGLGTHCHSGTPHNLRSHLIGASK